MIVVLVMNWLVNVRNFSRYLFDVSTYFSFGKSDGILFSNLFIEWLIVFAEMVEQVTDLMFWFFFQHFQVRIHLELTACEEQLLLKGGYGPWRPCCEELLCYQFRTVEAILWPVEAWGGISIQFGEFSYVNFLHFYRLSFSSLMFTNFVSFLLSLFFSFLSFYWYICLYIVRLISSWIG